jgi:hypothetical protein
MGIKKDLVFLLKIRNIKMAEEQKKRTGIAVRKIKDFIFFVNEPGYKKELEGNILVRFQHRLEVDKMVSFTLRTIFLYPGNTEEVVADLHVENIFEITDLDYWLINKS